MELTKKNIRTLSWLIIMTLLVAVGLININSVWNAVIWIIGLIFPFILGGCTAFILNIPMKLIEKSIFSTKKIKNKYLQKIKRPISLVLALIIVLALVVIVTFLIVPEIGRTMIILKDSIPGFIAEVQNWMNSITGSYPEIAKSLSALSIDWSNISNNIAVFLQKGAMTFLGSTVNAASSIIGGVVDFFLGFIFSVYVLLQKEKLGIQFRKLIYAYVPEKKADQFFEIVDLSSTTFSGFVTGQCTESVILSILFLIPMLVLHFPYALMISVLIGFLSLIPIFGTFIGCFIGAFLILMVSPIQAFWFIILFLIIQQIEGNLIYPYVVGGSVGLSSIWVLVAVTIGGAAMGILGMIITIPLFSIMYTLVRQNAGKRLADLKISDEKFKNPGL
ncbi:MAG: AI-2E family transporter [Eubacterium sp.]